jgi:hypothetical protein
MNANFCIHRDIIGHIGSIRPERDEEKWAPVFRPIPLGTFEIDHVDDFGLIQSKVIVI